MNAILSLPVVGSAATKAAPADVRPDAAPVPRKRYDIYAVIHKGLRACMAETLVAVGRTDPADGADVAATAARMRELVALFRGHLDKENAYVHPAMEARRPGSTAHIERDHAEHVAALHRLAAETQAIESADPATRACALAALYRELARFVADNLVHMAAEEVHHNAVLWETRTDEELMALERTIVATTAPELAAANLRWMTPALDPSERIVLLGKVRMTLPAEAFELTLSRIRPHLSEPEWRKLTLALAA